jgi:LysR family transcriptional regulator, nitrogen assimilation regulatory protein
MARGLLPQRRLFRHGVATQKGLELDPVAEADSLPVQLHLARRGLGATILPFLPMFSEVECGALSARPIVVPEITRHLVLASAVDRPVPPTIQRFAEMVVSEVLELVGSGRRKGILPEYRHAA